MKYKKAPKFECDVCFDLFNTKECLTICRKFTETMYREDNKWKVTKPHKASVLWFKKHPEYLKYVEKYLDMKPNLHNLSNI